MRTMSKAALAAKEIRQQLKKELPLVKFKVTSKNYSGGDSIRVVMVDQHPSVKEKVKVMTEKYCYGEFDGMTDYYNVNNYNKEIPQVKYIFIDNKLSNELRREIKEKMEKEYQADHYFLQTTNIYEWQLFNDATSFVWNE